VADIQVRVSDLTGKQDDREVFGRLVVRKYPGLDAPVQLDVLPDEVAGLQTMDDLVQLEYTAPGAQEATVLVVARSDFDGLSADMAEVLSKARGLRGRRATT